MENERSEKIPFDELLRQLEHGLRAAAGVTAEADQKAYEEARSANRMTRAFRRLAQPTPGDAAASAAEVHNYARGLWNLRAQLDPVAGAQLERDVTRIVTALPGHVEWHQGALSQAARRQAGPGVSGREIADSFRGKVQKLLDTIVPADAAANAPGIGTVAAPPHGSVLSPAARAFANGEASTERVVEHVESRMRGWWRERLAKTGLQAARPEITELAGGDPLKAVVLTTRIVGGIPVGDALDPSGEGRVPRGVAVVDPENSVTLIGGSGSGKTRGVIAPYVAYRAAAKDNVVVLTPQAPTIALLLPMAKALSGQAHVPIVDFGGEIVKEDSPEFTTWDVTRECLTVAGATNFAEAFAGPQLKARQDLGSSEVWGGMMADMYAAAGHTAAGIRARHGLDRSGLNGMRRVYDLMAAATDDELPDTLPQSVRAALASAPEKLAEAEAQVQAASAYAKGFHPRLRKIAYHSKLLMLDGKVKLSDGIVGRKLEELNGSLVYLAKKGDPTNTLVPLFQRQVTEHELQVMSPRPPTKGEKGDREIEPAALVAPGAGVTFVTYAHTGSEGLAAGAFTSAVLDKAIIANKDGSMLKEMGSAHSPTPLCLVVDEGAAGKHCRRLPDVVTDTRQMQITTVLSMTSYTQLEEVFGPNAGKFADAPCVIDLTPNAVKSASLAPMFGTQTVARTSVAMGPGGETTTVSESREPVLEPSDVNRLPRGQAVMSYQSDPRGDRLQLIALAAVHDPTTVVGAAAAFVKEHPETFEPIAALLGRLRPDLQERLELEKDPMRALVEGRPEVVAEAADPVADAVQEAADLAEDASKPTAKAEPEPAVKAKPEPVKEADVEPVKEEPEPVKEADVEPAKDEPEPADEDAESSQTTKRKPAQEAAPEPVTKAAPKPAEEVAAPAVEKEPEPAKKAAPEPVKQVKPEPVKEVKPEPVKEVKPEPVKKAEPEPVKEAEPVKQAEPEPVEQAEAEPVEAATPEPSEMTVDAALRLLVQRFGPGVLERIGLEAVIVQPEAEAVVEPEPEPVVEPEPEPEPSVVAEPEDDEPDSPLDRSRQG